MGVDVTNRTCDRDSMHASHAPYHVTDVCTTGTWIETNGIIGSTIFTVMSPATNRFPQRTVKQKGPQDVHQQLAHAERGALDNFLSWIA